VIIVKGERVVLVMKNGSTKKLPASYGILHDPDGKELPRCSVLLGPVRRTQQSIDGGRKGRAYFGSKYQMRRAVVAKVKGLWRPIGEVIEIRYTRRGRHAANYFHPFKSFSPTLSKNGRFYRLELRDGCIYDDRGFVFP
jgi:hypothetical protein